VATDLSGGHFEFAKVIETRTMRCRRLASGAGQATNVANVEIASTALAGRQSHERLQLRKSVVYVYPPYLGSKPPLDPILLANA
jgi:hypothetical protein